MATTTMTAPTVTGDVAEAARSGVDPSVPVGLRPDSEVVEKPVRRRFPLAVCVPRSVVGSKTGPRWADDSY